MAVYTIENEILKVSILDKGAELLSILNKQTSLEYIWDANPAFWPKSSPVLFPIVGGLKDNTYFYNDNAYTLTRHGFARDHVYEIIHQDKTSITFLLEANEEIKKNYPFQFEFHVQYELKENELKVGFFVKNTDDKEMYFSVGAHPAFKVPLTADTNYNDWYLQFSNNETEGIWPVTKDGLVENFSVPFFNNTDRVPLTKELFHKDALVFKYLKSNSISLLSDKTKHGVTVAYDHFPFMGIWSAKDADFVCIEPWCGISDSTSTSQLLNEKEGIHALQPNNNFERSYSIKVF